MKIRAIFKCPDAVDMAIENMECETEDGKEEIRDIFRKYVKHGELVTIEIDTETMQGIVVPV